MSKEKELFPVEVTYHFKLRLLQRIHGSQDSETKLAFQINLEQKKLDAEAREIFEKSTFLWQGALWEKVDIVNFYLYESGQDYWIVVSDTRGRKLITIYEAAFPDVPPKFSQDLLSRLLRHLKQTKVKRERTANRRVPYIDRREKAIDRYQKLLTHYQVRIAAYQMEIANAREEMESLAMETEQLTKVLCSPMAFMNDLKHMKR